MKVRALYFVTAFALLAGIELWGRFDAQLHATQIIRRDKPIFDFIFTGEAEPVAARMQPVTAFPQITSTMLIAANNIVCIIDGPSGRTSAPLQIYRTGPPAPVSFAPADINNQSVLFAAPGNASPNAMAAFVFGPPHQSLGEFGMIEGGHEFGVSLAAGNVSGDPTPELFAATATGGPGAVHMISPGRDDVTTFYPYTPEYQGGIRLATGDIDGDGFDELVTVQARGGQARFYSVVDNEPLLIGSGYPFGPTPAYGPYVDLFDVNNDGSDDMIFGSGGGTPLVRIVGFDGDEPRVFTQFRAHDGSGGVAVAGGLVNGALAVAVTPRDDGPDAREFFAMFLYHLQNGFSRSYQTEAFGARSTEISMAMFEPPSRR